MSMRTRIAQLNGKTQGKIAYILRKNGYMREDVDMIMQKGRLSDIADIIDMEDLM